MDPKRLEMIAEVARLYYEEEMNVKDIANIFETSPSSVSRILQEAKELKIVQVVIRYPFLNVPSLAQQLCQHLGLKEAYVLPDFKGSYADLMERVGKLAARVLEEHLESGMTLGVSLGLAVVNTARAFTVTREMNCTVVRLHGANDNEIEEGRNLAQIFSTQMGNQFKIIPCPFVLQSRETCEMFMREPSIREMIRIAQESDVALVGLGSLNPNYSTILRNQLLSKKELQELGDNGAVGEICGVYYGAEGNVLDVEFNHRIVAIDLEKLRSMKHVIGVAAGAAKIEPILGAATGKLINILVTDSETAKMLISRTEPTKKTES
ncbi:MAG: sugar-binding domain-containing protein [Anaerolineaceae bacterium]|nr:sugar-binding domain-containing protein [Anaerolineaceae bacterium]